LDWHYPDGTQLQRNGIIPEVIVEKSHREIIERRDVIMEKALEYIESQ
jgi:C-terminal processing protease CtpA/Prc